jgi:hypothetical protein
MEAGVSSASGRGRVSVFAIDPGNVESAYVRIDGDMRPLAFGKVPNEQLLSELTHIVEKDDVLAIEMVASYGMPVGAEVFETCVWIGRFAQEVHSWWSEPRAHLIYRRDVKLHHCGSARAKDGNIRQALIDRFGDKGTKAAPGFFYGFKADLWQAMALAVYVADSELT